MARWVQKAIEAYGEVIYKNNKCTQNKTIFIYHKLAIFTETYTVCA